MYMNKTRKNVTNYITGINFTRKYDFMFHNKPTNTNNDILSNDQSSFSYLNTVILHCILQLTAQIF